jgi:hypothetical protein
MCRFCGHLLPSRPADIHAMKMLAACELLISPYFHEPMWADLRDADVWDSSWPVYSALNGYLWGGYDTAGDLAQVLTRDKVPRPGISALYQLKPGTALGAKEWADDVLAVYSDRSGSPEGR